MKQTIIAVAGRLILRAEYEDDGIRSLASALPDAARKRVDLVIRDTLMEAAAKIYFDSDASRHGEIGARISNVRFADTHCILNPFSPKVAPKRNPPKKKARKSTQKARQS